MTSLAVRFPPLGAPPSRPELYRRHRSHVFNEVGLIVSGGTMGCQMARGMPKSRNSGSFFFPPLVQYSKVRRKRTRARNDYSFWIFFFQQ